MVLVDNTLINQNLYTMKKLLLLLSTALMLSFAGCESLRVDNVVGGSYDINGAIQKGPFVQGSNITVQPLNKNLKPIGQMYTTQTTNDAGMFEMDGVNSKYAEIIATGYYFDEVEGEISTAMLTLRSIADLNDGTQTNVNLLTTLTYNRIKHLVTNGGKSIADASQQAERELYTALGIPMELQPSVSCGAMNIANNGDGDGLLLAISAVVQEGRTVGELSEYVAKFATDLADDGQVAQTLLEKFNLDGQHLLHFEGRIKDNLEARYDALGIECNIPDYAQYLPYLGKESEYFVIPFTYHEGDFIHTDEGNFWGIVDHFYFETDVEYIGHEYRGGYGEIYLSAPPTTIVCQCYALRTIEIPDSVKSISFPICISLESITLPNSVTSIEDEAFSSCTSLNSITIPDSVTKIGKNAFTDCVNLTEVIIPENVTEFGKGAFAGCISLTEVVIPESVTSIGDFAFLECSSIESISIPESVTTIGEGAFAGCLSLAEFKGKYASDNGRCLIKDATLMAFAPYGISDYVVPEEIQSVGWSAFRNCTNLVSVTIPSSVNAIGVQAFSGCSNLTNITIPEGVNVIYWNAFQDCSSLTRVTIPNSITELGSCAFQNCTNLQSIVFDNNNLTIIEAGTFYGCKNLVSSTLPESITEIGEVAFYGCESLVDIHIPDGVYSIGELAFYGCTSLQSVTIPESVWIMGDGAFIDCYNLWQVYCKPTTPPTIQGNSWGRLFSVSPYEIYIPKESEDAYKKAPYWHMYSESFIGYDFN